jgi:hypothetical protein
MKRYDDTSSDHDSWGQILSRCGPGLAEEETAANAPRAIVASERGSPPRRSRTTGARVAILIGLALAGSIAIPQGLLRPEQETAGPTSEVKTASIAALRYPLPSTLVSREPLANQPPSTFALKELGPASADSAGNANDGTSVAALPVPVDGVGGPFLPAEPPGDSSAGGNESLQARLSPSSAGSGELLEEPLEPGLSVTPEVAALQLQLRLRDTFAQSQSRAFMADAGSLSADDAQVLIDRGKDLMALGDIVTARLIFQKVMDSGYAEGAFHLARSYDPKVLRTLPVHASVKGDAQKAKTLYALAEENEKTISLSR